MYIGLFKRNKTRAFSPASISGLIFNFTMLGNKFQEVTGASATTKAQAANDPIGTVLAPTGQYFTAPAVGQRPLLKFGANGRPYLQTDGVDDRLDYTSGTSSPAVTEPLSFFANAMWPVTSGSPFVVYVANITTDGFKFTLAQSGTSWVLVAGRDNVANYGNSTTLRLANTWCRVGCTLVNPAGVNACTYYVNGATDGVTTSSTAGASGSGRIGDNRLLAQHPAGCVSDILIYNRVLTAPEIAKVDAYLAARIPS